MILSRQGIGLISLSLCLGDLTAAGFSAKYQARFEESLDPSCDGLASTVKIGCFGSISILEQSDDVECLSVSSEMGLMECEGNGEVTFQCDGEVVGDVDAFLNYPGGEQDECQASSGSSNRLAQLGVFCPDQNGGMSIVGGGEYAFDDYYFECGQGSEVAKVQGRYTCRTETTCASSVPCALSWDDLIVNADHDKFLDCIEGDTSFPAQGEQVRKQALPGDYSATFQANWQLSLDTTVCGGDFAGKRLTCTNGNITLVQALQDNVACQHISESELACEDTSPQNFVNGFSGVVFQCNSTDAIPEAQAEYTPADSVCEPTIPAEMAVAHYIQLGVLCEAGNGAMVPTYDDFLVECGEKNDFEIMEGAFTCESAVLFAPGNEKKARSIDTASIRTDSNRWSGGGNDGCYQHAPPFVSPCVETSSGTDPMNSYIPEGHVPMVPLTPATICPTQSETTNPPTVKPSTPVPLPKPPTPPPSSNPPTPSQAPFTSPPGTVFSADYMARFKRILDSGCEGPDEDSLEIQCKSGNLEILNVSHPSIVCIPPQQGSISSATYTICQTTCSGEDCGDVYIEYSPLVLGNTEYISEDFGEITFRCSGEEVDDVDANFWILGTETTGETATCVGNERLGRNYIIGQFHVLCPNDDKTGTSFVNDDHYYECYSDWNPWLVNGDYSCETGLMQCPEGDLCEADYDEMAFVGDHHRYKECIQTNNGSPVPQPDVPETKDWSEGQYIAHFQAHWGYWYDEGSCSGQLTGLRMTCTNGVIGLVESAFEGSCEVVSDNEIECTETTPASGREYIEFVKYECTSYNEIPETHAEYFASDIFCDSQPDTTPARYLAMSILCGDPGDKSYARSEKTWECGKKNEYYVTGEGWFTCGEKVPRAEIIESLNTILPIPKVEVETDFRWAAYAFDTCYEYKAATTPVTKQHLPEKIRKGTAAPPNALKDPQTLQMMKAKDTSNRETSAASAALKLGMWAGLALVVSVLV